MKTLAIFLIGLAVCMAGQTILYPVADAYLDSSHPNTNYGGGAHDYDGYVFRDLQSTGAYFDLIVRFDISSLPTQIMSAVVTYNQQFVSSDELAQGPYLVFNVYEVNSTWSESTVTWNNAPSASSPYLPDHQDGDEAVVSFPVTSSVSAAVSASKQYVSYRLHSEDSQVMIYMREAGVQVQPHMIVVYS
jgi:hypothetical protein